MKIDNSKKSPSPESIQPNPEANKDLKIDIILPRFNESLGLKLLEETEKNLVKFGIPEENIAITRIPGALEIPYITKQILSLAKPPDAIIALGLVIRGETTHYDYVCESTINAITQLNITHKTPIVTGILTVENEQQAKDRIDPQKLNKGEEFAMTAIEMATIKRSLQ